MNERDVNELKAMLEIGPIKGELHYMAPKGEYVVSVSSETYTRATNEILDLRTEKGKLQKNNEEHLKQLAAKETEITVLKRNGSGVPRKVVIAYHGDVGRYGEREFVQGRGWFQTWSQTQVPLSGNSLIMIPIAIIEHEDGSVRSYDLGQFKFEEWKEEEK